MGNTNMTQYFDPQSGNESQIATVIRTVCEAMIERGYNPQSQIVGYIMSGDPTYITSYKNARSLIMKVERDEILDELVRYYLKNTVLRDK